MKNAKHWLTRNIAFWSHLEDVRELPVSEPPEEALGVPEDASQAPLEDVETPWGAQGSSDVDEVIGRG